MWLECPWERTDFEKEELTTEASDNGAGIRKGSTHLTVAGESYMAGSAGKEDRLGLERRPRHSQIVTYADDLVILCRKATPQGAMQWGTARYHGHIPAGGACVNFPHLAPIVAAAAFCSVISADRGLGPRRQLSTS